MQAHCTDMIQPCTVKTAAATMQGCGTEDARFAFYDALKSISRPEEHLGLDLEEVAVGCTHSASCGARCDTEEGKNSIHV